MTLTRDQRSDVLPTISWMIFAWRKQDKIGIRAAAKMIGISPATLSRIENGKPYDARTLLRLHAWLFGDGDRP